MGAHEEVRPVLPMPIRATPYRHQIEAFNFACELFGLLEGGGLDDASDGEMRSVWKEISKDKA